MKPTGKLNRLTRKLALVAGTAAVAATSSVGLLAVGGGVAHAQSSNDETIISNLSWLNLGIRGGSTSAGTDAIQWWADGGGEQQWNAYHYAGLAGTYYQNINSGLCLTTDGVAGDPLTQQPCSYYNPYQRWVSSFQWFYAGYTLYNPATGLNMDVQGASYWGGAEIDAWYPNNQVNQVFSTPTGGSLA
jgi:hypothetical protein